MKSSLIPDSPPHSQERLYRLLSFDRDLLMAPRKRAVEVLVGTDEVGRGCLAGPVVAAAVIMPAIDADSDLALQLARLNDSKQVNPKARAELSHVLTSTCRFAIAEASAAEVDELNVLYASLLAMRRAYRKLNVNAPALIAVDGNKKITSLRTEQVTIVDGDTFSASVAAASIIAKVYRDELMTRLSRKHPEYCWESNKGYRSRQHWTAIHEHGMTRWHRRRFVERWLGMPYPPGQDCHVEDT
jgi:ribonuclease HII